MTNEPTPSESGRSQWWAPLRRWPTLLGLTALWAALWGSVAPGTLLAGVVVAAIVTVVFPLPSMAVNGVLRPVRALAFLVRFHVDLVAASWSVARLVVNWKRRPQSGIVGVKLRTSDDLTMTMVAVVSSLIPGTLVVEAHRLTGVLYLHVLDLPDSGGPQGVRDATLDLERRILRMTAPRKELAELGLLDRRGAAQEPTPSGLPDPSAPPSVVDREVAP